MNKEYPGLITIQKFIYLLSDFYYTEFVTHLSAANATLPLKLAETIRKTLPAFDTHEELCKKIYGSFDKGPKQNFNQLASYTFRLSNALALNYPNYLQHNIFKIQSLINDGQGDEANFLADNLLEIAERTEDFQCQVFVLNFLSQQAYIAKNTAKGIKLDTQLNEVLNKEKIFTDIQLLTRKTLAETNIKKDELQKIKDYLLGFASNSSTAIRILSRHAYLIILYQFDLSAFEQPQTAELIEQVEKDLQNQSHVVFPYLLDLRNSLFFMKLNSSARDLNSKETEREFEALAQHYSAIKYWKTFVNTGQLRLIAIQCTRLYSKYEGYIYRNDYPAVINESDAGLIKDYLSKCRAFLNSNADTGKYAYEILSYRILYGMLLIFSGKKNIPAGIRELESVLLNDTQAILNTETDSIYLFLMLGYFSLKDYVACAKTFKRYSKSIKDMPVFEDNDTSIRAYYYMSQWFLTKNRQYPGKLAALLDTKEKNGSRKPIAEMMEYFSVTT